MLVSRYFGARDYGKMKTIVSTSLISFLILSILLGVFGAALATLIAQGISAVFSLLIFFYRIRQYKSPFHWFDGQELHSMLRIAIPSVLQQSTVSIGMMIVQAVVNPFGTQALAGYAATMRVENVFSLIFVSIGNAVSPYVSQNLGAKKIERIKKGYHASVSHCKYGKPCDSSVRCFDFCATFWYCICLACRTGRLACKFSDFLCGTQKIFIFISRAYI